MRTRLIQQNSSRPNPQTACKGNNKIDGASAKEYVGYKINTANLEPQTFISQAMFNVYIVAKPDDPAEAVVVLVHVQPRIVVFVQLDLGRMLGF